MARGGDLREPPVVLHPRAVVSCGRRSDATLSSDATSRWLPVALTIDLAGLVLTIVFWYALSENLRRLDALKEIVSEGSREIGVRGYKEIASHQNDPSRTPRQTRSARFFRGGHPRGGSHTGYLSSLEAHGLRLSPWRLSQPRSASSGYHLGDQFHAGVGGFRPEQTRELPECRRERVTSPSLNVQAGLLCVLSPSAAPGSFHTAHRVRKSDPQPHRVLVS